MFSSLNRSERQSSGRGLSASPLPDDQDTTVIPGSTQGMFRQRDADASLIATVSPLGGSQATTPKTAPTHNAIYDDSLSLSSMDFDIFSYQTNNSNNLPTPRVAAMDIRQASSEYFSLEQSLTGPPPLTLSRRQQRPLWPQLEQNDRLITQEVVRDNNWILLPANANTRGGGGIRGDWGPRGAETEVLPFSQEMDPQAEGRSQPREHGSLQRAVLGVLKFLGPQSRSQQNNNQGQMDYLE